MRGISPPFHQCISMTCGYLNRDKILPMTFDLENQCLVLSKIYQMDLRMKFLGPYGLKDTQTDSVQS